MRKHLIVLFLITLFVSGVMYISYPPGGDDDDQSAVRYQINEIINGNLLIGNVRYHTGYSFFIAPVAGIARLFGRFDERVWLLVQMAFHALIPFMVYDIVRRRRSANEAFIVALLVLLDPFGMQWAHFMLPNWLIAFCFVLALWLIQRSIVQPNHLLRGIVLAGLVLGIAVLARLNMAPVVAILGLSFFALTQFNRRQRFWMFTTLGLSSAALLVIYTILIHYPSTGTFNLSCYTGTNLLVSVYGKNFSITAQNGEVTRQLLNLITLKPLHDLNFTSDIYPNWSNPNSWAAPDERQTFLNQPYGTPPQQLPYAWPAALFYYLGPCETDDLLLAVHNEAIRAQPARWLMSIPTDLLNMLVQRPLETTLHPLYLPQPDQLTFSGPSRLGFRRAEGEFYNGQWVWEPGIILFSRLFNIWNLYKWLMPLAIVWAFWSRDWFYRTTAILLLVFLIALSIFGNPAPRLFAPLYPFWPLLIGGLLSALIVRLIGKNRRSIHQEAEHTEHAADANTDSV